jgi:hypothetical protein
MREIRQCILACCADNRNSIAAVIFFRLRVISSGTSSSISTATASKPVEI